MSRKAYTQEERESIRTSMLRRSARVFAEKGLRNASLEDIYSPEGISKTFFYTFFPSKTSLIAEMFRMQSSEMLEALRRNVWDYGAVNGMRETLSDVLDGRWFIVSFDDQVYLRDIMSEEEFNAFKNDRIVLFADILNMIGVPVSRMDPRLLQHADVHRVGTLLPSGLHALPLLRGCTHVIGDTD